MKRMIAAVVLLALCVPLGGCPAGVAAYVQNRDCTTRLSGEMAFGSITPTGKTKWSATCRPHVPGVAPTSPEPKDVAEPPKD